MSSWSRRLSHVDERIGAAVVAVQADKESSPLLRAAIKEVWRKSRKAIGTLKSADEWMTFEYAREIENASRVAQEAVLYLSDLKERTKQAVLEAHSSISTLVL